MGGMRRVAEMQTVFELAGAEVHDVRLLDAARVGASSFWHADPGAVVRGRAVPETLAW